MHILYRHFIALSMGVCDDHFLLPGIVINYIHYEETQSFKPFRASVYALYMILMSTKVMHYVAYVKQIMFLASALICSLCARLIANTLTKTAFHVKI